MSAGALQRAFLDNLFYLQGRAWDKHSVQRLLTSPLYAGKVRYDGELHDGVHDAIIDNLLE